MIIVSLILSSLSYADDAPHFARVCAGIVDQVIVVKPERLHTQPLPAGCKWVETAHDGSKGKNYAARDHKYDEELKAFVKPKRFASWVLNKDTAKYEAPVPYPGDGKDYAWNEEKQKWEIRQSKP